MSGETPMFGAEGAPLYGRCPRIILRDPTLSAQARLLWTILEDHASKEGDTPWPSQATLAGYMGCEERSIRRWLNELCAAGWLDKRQRRNNTNLHVLIWPKQNQTRTPVSGRPGHHSPATAGHHSPPKKNHQEEPVKKTPPASRPPAGGDDDGAGDEQLGLLPASKAGGVPTRKQTQRARSKQRKEHPAFPGWWESTNKHGSRSAAAKAFSKALDAGATLSELDTQLANYNGAREIYHQRFGAYPSRMMVATFLNSKRETWSTEWTETEVAGYWPAPSGRTWDTTADGRARATPEEHAAAVAARQAELDEAEAQALAERLALVEELGL